MNKLKEITTLLFELTFIFAMMVLEKLIRLINKKYSIILEGFD